MIGNYCFDQFQYLPIGQLNLNIRACCQNHQSTKIEYLYKKARLLRQVKLRFEQRPFKNQKLVLHINRNLQVKSCIKHLKQYPDCLISLLSQFTDFIRVTNSTVRHFTNSIRPSMNLVVFYTKAEVYHYQYCHSSLLKSHHKCLKLVKLVMPMKQCLT